MSSGQPLYAVDLGSDRLSSDRRVDGRPRSLLSQLSTQVRVIPAACAVLVFLASFINTIDLGASTSAEEASVGLDTQVAIKLSLAAAVAAIGGIGLLLSKRVQQSLFGLPGLALVFLGVVFVITSIFAYAEAATVCRAAALIYCAYLCFIPTAVSLIGLRNFLFAVMAGLTLHMLVSWMLYLFVPSIGVFQEELAGSTFVYRMGGLGHPNAIGRVAALAGVLSLAMLRSRDLAPRFPGARTYLAWILVLAVATVFASFSRTSMVAAVAAAGFLLIDRIWSRGGLAWVILGFCLVIGSLLGLELTAGSDILGRTLLTTATKTGDVEELLSVTGRTEIWAEAVRLIAQRPLTGWGLNSAPFLLEDFSQHTHNAVLHATLSGGLIAGLLVVLLLLWNLVFGLRDSEPIVRAISVFILISSLVEDTIIDTFPFPTTTLWIFALLYPSLHAASDTRVSKYPERTMNR